ncbi:MAG: glycosyltransferase [Planctomycetes bacterium]|nr:glycosyltransferase [Planctomycetota bacterium]
MSSKLRPHHARSVIALIATHGRDDLLLQRAIPSILGQTAAPERLMLVVDQTKDELPDSALASFAKRVQARCGGIPASVLRNRRTLHTAAGAWNSGIDQLHRDARLMARPNLCFVAVLDDDDAWEPGHLELCIEQAVTRDLGMVASGVIRHESVDDPGHRHGIPERLNPRELFIRGQHIQGSNLFVRLDMLLKAGCFDEHLPSCTDRDMCIRLADLPDLRFGRVEDYTVHHFADPRSDRLSAPGSRPKLEGLTRFWGKYADRFDHGAREEFAKRAHDLFGWALPKAQAVAAVIPNLSEPPRPLSLVVGFVTDAMVPVHVCELLEDLASLASRPGVARLKVVVVENGPLPANGERSLHALISDFTTQGLDIDLITIERQREDWERGQLIDTTDPTKQRNPIAVSRTVLNTYVARAAAGFPCAWAWILDDDKRLNCTVDHGDGTVTDRPSPDLAVLCALQDSGVDVVIGPDTDAAPLPFTATLRVQLLDLQHHLRVLAASQPGSEWPDRGATDAPVRASFRDFYYDLSRFTEHLETPFTLPSRPGRSTAGEVLGFIGSRVDRLLAGEAVFRPLTVDIQTLAVEAAEPSVQRGGSTIFFDPNVLLEFPQTLARLGDRYVRRSDMLVSQLMRDQLGLRIVMHPAAAVRHDRTCTERVALDDRTLREDVLGYALYRSASEIMQQRAPEMRRGALLAWEPVELRRAVKLARKYINERLAALTLSGWRIIGLAEAIRRTGQDLGGAGSAWRGAREQESLRCIILEMDRICGMFKPTAMAAFAEQIRKSVNDADIRDAFLSMDGLISEYRATHGAPAVEDEKRAVARERRARALLKREYGANSLRLLGAGGEGVVFTDELRVYKVLDLLKRRPNHDTRAMLTRLANTLVEPKYLHPIAQVDERDATLILVYPYEPSEPYAGGRGPDLIGLLRECKASGIVFRNMHPKNLRVSATGLKLVDYGSDIRPFSSTGYRSMAERAYLSWRWAHRPDLDELMRRALIDKSMPELDGFERFWTALLDERPTATRVVSAIVDPIVLESGARTALDYGCGKKARSARQLADDGLTVVGFDPGAGISERWDKIHPLPNGLVLTADFHAALSRAPFDAVYCSLVLCELEDGPEYEQALADLRNAVRDGGLVVVTVCNPFATFGGPTSLHFKRDLPADAGYQDSFWFVENADRGPGHREFHRPLRQLERDLLRHGIRVERRVESRTVDLDRFEPASDFMTLVCRPIPAPTLIRRVSLVIKTCAMESLTIERQVDHLVRQLEGPRVFCERILAIDSRRDVFLRQHARPDWDALLDAAERLRIRGFIDRFFVGPCVGGEARHVNRDWFDIATDATHADFGAPLAMPLSAFEACEGDYILQVDSDLLIGRSYPDHDYLGEMMKAIESTPNAVTASLNIAREGDMRISATHEGAPWRVEVRGCLLHRARLLAARPYPNTVEDGAPSLAWHRSMDDAAREGRIESLRGGRNSTFFVHPPNEVKRCVADWMLLVDLVEKGYLPGEQLGQVELTCGPLQWIPRDRSEPFVFIITGRNVPPGRAMRCLGSLFAQSREDWGAVIIDDGSLEWSREQLRLALVPWDNRITLIQPLERRGQLANLALAIRHICTNPDSVIITLDLDDALIGTGVLDRVSSEYLRGADVTVGSMLRTDKHVEYPVSFDDPRGNRGGNIWQHLRTFRKRLFDSIPDDALRIAGRYVDIAVDWAFMLPIVEMAEHPVWIREPLYLYEPSGMGKGRDREKREEQIAAIVSRPRLEEQESSTPAVVTATPHHVMETQ